MENGGMEHRVTVLEQTVAGIKFDLELQRKAWIRRSDEFRAIELAVNKMTTHQDDARAAEAAQYRRIELRVQVLTLVIGISSVVSPLAVTLLVSH